MSMTATYLTPAALAAQCLRDDPSFPTLSPSAQRAEARAVLAQIDGVDPDDLDTQLEALALASGPSAAPAKPDLRVVDTGRKKIVVAAPVLAPAAPEPPVAAPVVAEEPIAQLGWQPQPCRMPSGCTETLSATGRCMQCGAQRRMSNLQTVTRPVVEEVRGKPDPIYSPAPPRPQKVRKDKQPRVQMRKGVKDVTTPEGFARKRARLFEGNLIEQVKALTNAPDHYIAKLIGRSRPTVQAYIQGRIQVELSRWQMTQLRQLLAQQHLALADALDELDALLVLSKGGVE
jgi:hypothetical protein